MSPVVSAIGFWATIVIAASFVARRTNKEDATLMACIGVGLWMVTGLFHYIQS